jgi:hypothetical protein
MSESATDTAERGDSQVHQESDKQMVEGEKEAFWRERFREANAFAYEVEAKNHDLEFQIGLLQRQLAYADKRLDSAIGWWRKLEK